MHFQLTSSLPHVYDPNYPGQLDGIENRVRKTRAVATGREAKQCPALNLGCTIQVTEAVTIDVPFSHYSRRSSVPRCCRVVAGCRFYPSNWCPTRISKPSAFHALVYILPLALVGFVYLLFYPLAFSHFRRRGWNAQASVHYPSGAM